MLHARRLGYRRERRSLGLVAVREGGLAGASLHSLDVRVGMRLCMLMLRRCLRERISGKNSGMHGARYVAGERGQDMVSSKMKANHLWCWLAGACLAL